MDIDRVDQQCVIRNFGKAWLNQYDNNKCDAQQQKPAHRLPAWRDPFQYVMARIQCRIFKLSSRFKVRIAR